MYKVTKKYAKGKEAPVGHPYKTMQEAKNFINTEVHKDAIMKVDTTYYLYEGMDVIEEFSSLKVNAATSKSDDKSGTSSSTNPFSTRLQPRGANLVSGEEKGKSEK